MCQKIREMNGMSPSELLLKTEQSGIFPVDVAQICYNMGIRLMPFDFSRIEMQVFQESGRADTGDILGAIVANENDLAILYKKDDDVNSRRFTIAHELAHSCLHMEPDSKFHIEFRTELQDGSTNEREANAFARKLLIPSDALRVAMGGAVSLDEKAVSALAMLFMVPDDIMLERLAELEIPVSAGPARSFARPANNDLLKRMKLRLFS